MAVQYHIQAHGATVLVTDSAAEADAMIWWLKHPWRHMFKRLLAVAAAAQGGRQ